MTDSGTYLRIKGNMAHWGRGVQPFTRSCPAVDLAGNRQDNPSSNTNPSAEARP